MFINFSNHPSKLWAEDERNAALQYGTIQRIVLAILSIWKGKRKKLSDKAKGTAELIRELSLDFTAMIHMLDQK